MNGEIEHATFTRKTGPSPRTPIKVQFNPVSLQYTITNTLREESQGGQKKQFVSQSSGKLTMDLIFDTTGDGQDVRTFTDQIAQLMKPVEEDGNKTPAVVAFEWGKYVFNGMVESYKETIDFFSADGVPLRATINLGLAQQDRVFEPTAGNASADTKASLTGDTVIVPVAPGDSAASLGARAGNPRAAAAIASANGQASMRFVTGGALAVASASVSLGGPVAFASGGAGLSAGAGIGGGIGLGISGSAGASIGLGGGVGVGGGASAGFRTGSGGFVAGSAGSALSAGVSASAGAFAELRTGGPGRLDLRVDPSRLLPRNEVTGLATDRGASFGVGGQATIAGSASLRANVTGSAAARARLDFGD